MRLQPQLDELAPARMSEPTALVPLSEAARLYAAASVRPQRDWFEAVIDLMHRIHAEFEFDARRHHRQHPGRGGAGAPPRRLPGLCSPDAGLPARPRPAGAVCVGLPADRSAAGPAAPDGRGCLTRLGGGLLPAARLGRVRSDQRPAGRHPLHHPGLGFRLRRCGAAARRDPGGRGAADGRVGERDSAGLNRLSPRRPATPPAGFRCPPGRWR